MRVPDRKGYRHPLIDPVDSFAIQKEHLPQSLKMVSLPLQRKYSEWFRSGSAEMKLLGSANVSLRELYGFPWSQKLKTRYSGGSFNCLQQGIGCVVEEHVHPRRYYRFFLLLLGEKSTYLNTR